MMRLALLVLVSSSVIFGKAAPAFRGELLEGGKTSLDSQTKPDRLLLVSFWATWCIPCMEELTHVTKKLKENPSLPVDLLTVNVDDEQRSEVPSTMRQMGFSFPVILDPQKQILSKYHKAGTLPYSVLISPTRDIEAEFNGYHEAMFDRINQAIDKMRSPRKG